ncbi:hypothetical protein A2U01_0109703, partial [Trifolium medium]|nr:hypothetical protein [Trifolium medium]
MHDEKSEAL